MTWFKSIASFNRPVSGWSTMCLFLLLLPVSAQSDTTQPCQAKVIGVADGDTITVLQGESQIKIRLYGIDCPESHQALSHSKSISPGNIMRGVP